MGAPPDRTILLLSFYFPPDTAPGALRAGRFFKYLPEFGYRPVVITQAEIPPRPDVHILPAPMKDIPDKKTFEGWGELVLRKWVFPTEMAMFWSLRAARLARDLHRKHAFCGVISTSPPFNTHLAAMNLKRRFGIPWIADFRDPLAENPFRDYGSLSRTADSFVERRIFRSADAMIGVTDRMLETWKRRSPGCAGKMHLLWNGYDPQEGIGPRPLPARPSRTLLHIGSLYGPRHPMGVLRSMMRLVESGRLPRGSVEVELLGDIAYQIRDANADLLQSLTASGLLRLSDAVPRPEALRRMSETDYLMLLDMHGGADSPAVPAKIFEYILVGRPVLAMTTPNSPVERILAQSGVDFAAIYPQDTDAQVDGKLLAFLTLPSAAKAPSDWFRDTFDGRRQTGALGKLLDQLQKK